MPGVEPWLKPEVIAKPAIPTMDLEWRIARSSARRRSQQFQNDSDVIKHLDPEAEKKPLLSLYPGWNYDQGLQWGMSIDMTACIGCNACVVACQAENNIAVVGKEEVQPAARNALDPRSTTISRGDTRRSPKIIHQPVPCMHCENAPCE